MKRKVFLGVVIFIATACITTLVTKVWDAVSTTAKVVGMTNHEDVLSPYVPPRIDAKTSSNNYFLSDKDKKLVQVHFTKSGPTQLELPRYYSDGIKRYGNAMILTFDKNLFAISMTKRKTPNGVDWNLQTDKLLSKIKLAKNQYKVFVGYDVNFEVNRAKIFPYEKDLLCTDQINVLLTEIQTAYNINLIEQH